MRAPPRDVHQDPPTHVTSVTPHMQTEDAALVAAASERAADGVDGVANLTAALDRDSVAAYYGTAAANLQTCTCLPLSPSSTSALAEVQTSIISTQLPIPVLADSQTGTGQLEKAESNRVRI